MDPILSTLPTLKGPTTTSSSGPRATIKMAAPRLTMLSSLTTLMDLWLRLEKVHVLGSIVRRASSLITILFWLLVKTETGLGLRRASTLFVHVKEVLGSVTCIVDVKIISVLLKPGR